WRTSIAVLPTTSRGGTRRSTAATPSMTPSSPPPAARLPSHCSRNCAPPASRKTVSCRCRGPWRLSCTDSCRWRSSTRFGSAAISTGTSPTRSTRTSPRCAELLRCGIDEAAGLAGPELRVVTARCQKFGVASLLEDPAAIEDDEAVHLGDGRQAVGDGEHGLAGHQRLQ